MTAKSKAKKRINALMNINPEEWPSVIISWLLRFFFHLGFVVGSTILTALFVSRFGIDMLPVLFIANSVFIAIGTFYFSRLIKRYSNIDLMNFSLLLGALLLALGMLIYPVHPIVFVVSLIVAQSIFLAQLEIFILSFTEELFTPKEGERVFPIIESGQLVGGIAGGILISGLAAKFPANQIVYFWIIALFSIALITKLFPQHNDMLPRLYRQNHEKSKPHEELKETMGHITKIPFFKNMFFIVLFFWIIHHLVHYQFTHYVAQSVEANLIAGQSFESQLAYKLGALEAIFHASALLIQVFVASRVISSLGIIKSLAIHPIISVFGAISLAFMPQLAVAAIAKNNLEAGNIIHLNAYHNCYYSIVETIRAQVREFFEGYIKPLATAIGMGFILLIEFILKSNALAFFLNFIVIILAGVSFFLVKQAKSAYTANALKLLNSNSSPASKKNAISILLQKGHTHHASQVFAKRLVEILKSDNEHESVKVAALEAFSHKPSKKSISVIISCLSDPSSAIRSAAVKALENAQLKDRDSQSSLIGYIQSLITQEKERPIRIALIKVLQAIEKYSTIQFLKQALKHPDKNVADYIYATKLVHDKSFIPLLKSFLDSDNEHIQSNALVALWHIESDYHHLQPVLEKLLSSSGHTSLQTMIFILSEIDVPNTKHHLLPHLKSHDPHIKLLASHTLGQNNHHEVVPVLSDLICHTSNFISQEAKNILKTLPISIRRKVEKKVNSRVSNWITQLISHSHVNFLEDLSEGSLLQLQQAYALAEDHHAVADIQHIIQSR